MTADITVYTKSVCPNCVKTKNLLKQLDLEYAEISIEENPEVLDFLKSQGFMAAPVVMTENDSWAGFNEQKIRALAKSDTTDDDWDF